MTILYAIRAVASLTTLCSLTSAAPSPIIQARDSDAPDVDGQQALDPSLGMFRKAIHRYVYGCVNREKQKLEQAWEEAGDNAQAQTR